MISSCFHHILMIPYIASTKPEFCKVLMILQKEMSVWISFFLFSEYLTEFWFGCVEFYAILSMQRPTISLALIPAVVWELLIQHEHLTPGWWLNQPL